MQRFLLFASALCAILTQSAPARAGLYHQDVLAQFDIDESGNAIPLSFQSFMTTLNIVAETDRPDSARSKELLQAIQERKNKDKLSSAEVVAQSADLLRLRRDEGARNEAMGLLHDRYQAILRQPNDPSTGLILLHQAYTRQQRKQFQEAVELEYSALYDGYEFPKSMAGLSDKQRTWYLRLERDYYLPLLRLRAKEAVLRKAAVQDGLDPIFPSRAKEKLSAVRYVGESGKYEAGTIATAETAKLPKDAIAILQQLVLWDPDDPRLLWQLAELYNASGDLKSASTLLDLCVNAPRQYTNTELLEHRRTIQSALPALLEAEARRQAAAERERLALAAQANEQREQAKVERERALNEAEQRRRWTLVGVAAVLVLVVYWQAREFLRRLRVRRTKDTKLSHQVD